MKTTASGLWNAPLHTFEQLTSSNTWLLYKGNECVHGETVRALRQTRGRGRNGRSWDCREGMGLTFSAALRCSQCRLDPQYQGAVAALALARFFERHGMTPRLKWPNDVWVDHRKIAGILGESGSDTPDWVVVGVGCNLNQSAIDFDAAGLSGRAVSMSMMTGRRVDLDAVFADVLKTWQRTLDEMNRRGVSALRNGWRRRDALKGRRLVIADGDRRIQGTATGIDAHMGLTVRDALGTVITVHSGEVAHIEGVS